MTSAADSQRVQERLPRQTDRDSWRGGANGARHRRLDIQVRGAWCSVHHTRKFSPGFEISQNKRLMGEKWLSLRSKLGYEEEKRNCCFSL